MNVTLSKKKVMNVSECPFQGIVFKGSHTEGPGTAKRSGREQVSGTKSLTSTSKSSGMGCPWQFLCGGGWSKQGLPGGPLWPHVWILYVTCMTHWPCPNMTSLVGAPFIIYYVPAQSPPARLTQCVTFSCDSSVDPIHVTLALWLPTEFGWCGGPTGGGKEEVGTWMKTSQLWKAKAICPEPAVDRRNAATSTCVLGETQRWAGGGGRALEQPGDAASRLTRTGASYVIGHGRVFACLWLVLNRGRDKIQGGC